MSNNWFILNVIYSCDGKAEFSAVIIWSSVSHDPSEIINTDLVIKKHLFLWSMLKNIICFALYCVKNNIQNTVTNILKIIYLII